jgi:hypothetical protein
MTETWSRSAELVNQRGLHARASAAFAREASRIPRAICAAIPCPFGGIASIVDDANGLSSGVTQRASCAARSFSSRNAPSARAASAILRASLPV